MSNKKKTSNKSVADSSRGNFLYSVCRDFDVSQNQSFAMEIITQNNVVSATNLIDSELNDVFVPKKEANLLVSESYYRISEDKKRSDYRNKGDRCSACGTFLDFAFPLNPTESDRPILFNANFCKDRLCPQCMRRRSMKMFANVSDIMNNISDKYEFIFCTFTIPNCYDYELNKKIDLLNSAFVRLTHRDRVKKINQGAFRVLEVTYNKKMDTYHPHLHVIFAVHKSYFQGKYYIKQPEWLDMWRECAGDPNVLFVNIQKIKSYHDSAADDSIKLNKAISEVVKYTVKDSNFLNIANEKTRDKVIFTLSEALYKRRLAQMSGVFRDVSIQLKQDDAFSDNADLIVTSDKYRFNPELSYVIYKYRWGCGCYTLNDVDVYVPNQECEVV